METERRQLRKSGDRLAGWGSWDAGAFGLVLSAYACTQNLHVACERRNGTTTAKLERRQSWWEGGELEKGMRSKDRSRTEWARGQGLPSGRYTQNPRDRDTVLNQQERVGDDSEPL